MEEVAGIKEAFDMMDTNKRNKINLEELRIGLQKLGHHVPDADLQILMEAVSMPIAPLLDTRQLNSPIIPVLQLTFDKCFIFSSLISI